MPIQHVSEFPATAPEQIDHFARLLSRSELRRKVFKEIYRGKSKHAKTAGEIGARLHVKPKRVLEVAGPLAANNLFEQTKHDKRTAYKKYPNINTVKRKILRLATNKQRLRQHVTIRRPQASVSEIRVRVDRGSADVRIDVRGISIDDIDNFARVRSLDPTKIPDQLDPRRLPEAVFKKGIAKILGQRGTFKDWAGEKSDLYTTHLRIKGRRYYAAFGFKGPATTGVLTPGKMGKNGDQIQRLFSSDVHVFIVQYEGEIAESVVEQMKKLAVAKSVSERQTVRYGIIALEDCYRLRIRYPRSFEAR